MHSYCTKNFYYKNYLSFASISLLGTLSELKGYTNALTDNILQIKDFVYVWQIFCLSFVHFQLKRIGYYEKVEPIEKRKVRFLNTIVITLIMLGFFMSMLKSVDLSRLKKQ